MKLECKSHSIRIEMDKPDNLCMTKTGEKQTLWRRTYHRSENPLHYFFNMLGDK